MRWGGLKRLLAVGVFVTATGTAVVACTPPSVLPDGSVPQDPPIASNGLIVDGDSMWVADLFGGQLVRFDPVTGHILKRYGPADGISPPDDGVVLDDGTLIYTSPTGKIVGRIHPDGSNDVVANFGFGPNPIIRDPNDPNGAVIIGDAMDASTGLYRVFLDGRPSELIGAGGLPPINSFSLGPDGRLWAPAGGFASVFGTGVILRIDLLTGVPEQFPVTFPDEGAKTGFNYDVAAKFGPDGQLYVLQGFDAAVYRVDPTTGVAHRIIHIPSDVGDNLAFTADGRLFASGFFGQVYEIFADGTGRQVPIGA